MRLLRNNSNLICSQSIRIENWMYLFVSNQHNKDSVRFMCTYINYSKSFSQRKLFRIFKANIYSTQILNTLLYFTLHINKLPYILSSFLNRYIHIYMAQHERNPTDLQKSVEIEYQFFGAMLSLIVSKESKSQRGNV